MRLSDFKFKFLITVLNLLPQPQRTITERALVLLALQRTSAVLLLVVLVMATLLLVSRLILQRQFETIIAESTYLTGTHSTLTREIEEVNEGLRRLEKIQSSFVRMDTLIADVAARVPPEITLNRLHEEPSTRILTLAGEAKTRSSLLAFVEALEASPFLTKIKNPLENVLSEENLSFTLTATIREGTLSILPQNQ